MTDSLLDDLRDLIRCYPAPQQRGYIVNRAGRRQLAGVAFPPNSHPTVLHYQRPPKGARLQRAHKEHGFCVECHQPIAHGQHYLRGPRGRWKRHHHCPPIVYAYNRLPDFTQGPSVAQMLRESTP